MVGLFFVLVVVVALLSIASSRGGTGAPPPGWHATRAQREQARWREEEIRGHVAETNRSAGAVSSLIESLGLKWQPDGRAAGTVAGVRVSLSVEEGGGRLVATVAFDGPLGLATATEEIESFGHADALERWYSLRAGDVVSLRDGVATLELHTTNGDSGSAIRQLAAIGAIDGKDREAQLFAVAQRSTERRVVERALGALLAHGNAGERRAVLVELFAADAPLFHAIALDHVVANRLDGFDRNVVADVIATDATLAAAAIRAAGRLEVGEAETGLISALSRDAELAAEAARSLAVVGTRVAVEPLAALRDALLVAPSVKEAARDAVRQIQARLGPSEEGRLSLQHAAEEAGALSLATEGGGLSLAGGASGADAGQHDVLHPADAAGAGGRRERA